MINNAQIIEVKENELKALIENTEYSLPIEEIPLELYPVSYQMEGQKKVPVVIMEDGKASYSKALEQKGGKTGTIRGIYPHALYVEVKDKIVRIPHEKATLSLVQGLDEIYSIEERIKLDFKKDECKVKLKNPWQKKVTFKNKKSVPGKVVAIYEQENPHCLIEISPGMFGTTPLPFRGVLNKGERVLCHVQKIDPKNQTLKLQISKSLDDENMTIIVSSSMNKILEFIEEAGMSPLDAIKIATGAEKTEEYLDRLIKAEWVQSINDKNNETLYYIGTPHYTHDQHRALARFLAQAKNEKYNISYKFIKISGKKYIVAVYPELGDITIVPKGVDFKEEDLSDYVLEKDLLNKNLKKCFKKGKASGPFYPELHHEVKEEDIIADIAFDSSTQIPQEIYEYKDNIKDFLKNNEESTPNQVAKEIGLHPKKAIGCLNYLVREGVLSRTFKDNKALYSITS